MNSVYFLLYIFMKKKLNFREYYMKAFKLGKNLVVIKQIFALHPRQSRLTSAPARPTKSLSVIYSVESCA